MQFIYFRYLQLFIWYVHIHILQEHNHFLLILHNNCLPIFELNLGSFQMNHPQIFYRKVILKYFPKFTGKNLWWSLFFVWVVGLAQTFCKKTTSEYKLIGEFENKNSEKLY